MTDILEKKQIIETDTEQKGSQEAVLCCHAHSACGGNLYPVLPAKILYHTDILGTRSGEHFYIGWRTRFAGILVWNRLEQYAIL